MLFRLMVFVTPTAEVNLTSIYTRSYFYGGSTTYKNDRLDKLF